MENLNEMYTDSVEKLAKLNMQNNNYMFSYDWYFKSEEMLSNFNWKMQGIKQKLVYDDFDILKDLETGYQFHQKENPNKPIIGDAIQMPDGKFVYVCHSWDDHAQTTPHGSFGLFGNIEKASLSYSGGLDSGMKLRDIYLTDEEHLINVWFCHKGVLQAHCGIRANIKCRVWKCKPGSNLSGVITERNY